ncbi:adenosylcobinamide-GDP ribazoletransferase [Oceanobacillus neutriphilus]|uniref:Adenosylcobinamide-GDP ribazoletransferase n=1 Tax=Oceanobacillus neutriphilus TaxID=531815 RepID=A0ABQ2P0T0_9BACI|nr:adenosylcobinamide-GDP ribazoletransferase [Oceanobacillus neutriphilus]GGP15248.1 adenosylcobinamide-GDP ribazoletransferase [Oceanobacillus neutriphilus]
MLYKIRLFFTGILVNLQFFTSIPIKSQFSLDQNQLKYVLRTFPVLGLLQGSIYAAFIYILHSFTPFTDLIMALFLWLLLIILSGGIHLDGWIDTSDAYFSYKDPEKRLEIMKDPRTGAFGVLSVIVLLFTRFIILYELIQIAHIAILLFIILIPFLGKMLLGVFLQTLPPARTEGMASFFQRGKSNSLFGVYAAYLVIIGSFITWLQIDLLFAFLLFIAVTLIAGLFIAGSITKNFNGITGDTLGASSEGMELLLWLTLLVLHYFAMV